MTKACSTCGIKTSSAGFRKSSKSSDGLRSQCKVCEDQYNCKRNADPRIRKARIKAARRRRRENLDQARAQAREYDARNRVKRRRAARIRYKKKVGYWRSWYQRRGRKLARDRYVENAELIISSVRAWQKANPEKVRVRYAKKRARKANAPGTHCASDVIRIRKAQKDKCIYCGINLNGGGHLDHRKPLARGGSNWPRNLQWLCQRCNQRKHAKSHKDFVRELRKVA